MNLDSYSLKPAENCLSFEFKSEGLNGNITKIIKFEFFDDLKIWNLGFGDLNSISGNISDSIKSNNGDVDKVLATAAKSVLIFLEKYPDALIYIEGSTNSRTRLYKIALSKNYEEISNLFLIWGLLNDNWHIFEKNIAYEAFLIKRK